MRKHTRVLFREAWPVVAAALALSACKGKDVLVEVDTVAAGEECPEGGISVVTGIDEDKDGTLTGDEIASSETICAGVSGEQGEHGTLTRETVLPEGDESCPFGGLMVQSGPDDGSGGGTAGDGILQDGEVTSTSYACNGEPARQGTDIEPPAGPVGTAVFDLSGGDGTRNDGGDGQSFQAYYDDGTVGGGIRLFQTGQAVSPVAYPATVSVYLGRLPVIVSSDTDVLYNPDVNPDTETLDEGDLYLTTNNPTLWRWNDTTKVGEEVTGLRVEQGATLTLRQNYEGYARLRLLDDLHLAGTLTTDDGDGGKAWLDLDVGNWIGESSGLVDLSGDDPGEAGHDFSLYAWYDIPGADQDGGAVFNRSTIDVSGADGPAGGSAAEAYLEGQIGVYNLGTVVATGGTGSTTSGGAGGFAGFDCDHGTLFNGGTLELAGGNGVDQGGDGGEAYMYSGYLGHVANTGSIHADGGASAACTDECSGGDGGEFYLDLCSNDFTNTGDLSARGGGSPVGTSDDAVGGQGGDLYLEMGSDCGGWYGSYIPIGDVHYSGDIDLAGGAGGTGGRGGWTYLYGYANGVPNDQEIVLLGYPSIDLSGGAGGTNVGQGGDAGYFELQLYASGSYTQYDDGPGGSVVNYVDVDTSGGDGPGGGGAGGDFSMYTDDDYGASADWVVAVNHGNVDATGGTAGNDADNDGGTGGEIDIWGFNGVTNGGNLDASGGGADSEQSDGGGSGGIHLLSDQGLVQNSGDLTNDGGSNPGGYGGFASTVEIVGAEVDNSGALRANGGDGASTGIFYGGDGGVLFLHSLWGSTTQTSATLEVEGGSGSVASSDGEVFIDGVNVTEDWTTP